MSKVLAVGDYWHLDTPMFGATGANSDGEGAPEYEIFEDYSDSVFASGTMVTRASRVGVFKARHLVTAAMLGHAYVAYGTSTVDGVEVTDIIGTMEVTRITKLDLGILPIFGTATAVGTDTITLAVGTATPPQGSWIFIRNGDPGKLHQVLPMESFGVEGARVAKMARAWPTPLSGSAIPIEYEVWAGAEGNVNIGLINDKRITGDGSTVPFSMEA